MNERVLLAGPAFAGGLALESEDLGPSEAWQVQVAPSGTAALAALEQAAFDAVVVDGAIAEVDPRQLLRIAAERHPGSEIFLCADVSPDTAEAPPVGERWQLLAKPISAPVLSRALKRAFSFRTWLPSRAARELLHSVNILPSPPATYLKVLRALESPDSSLDTIGQIIAQDPAMTAKLLQLANSAAFGLQQQVADPTTAVMYLGLETTKALILLAHTFSYFEKLRPADFSLEVLWNHSLMTAHAARQLARAENLRGEAAAPYYTSGLLHDLGKLIYAANVPLKFSMAIRMARDYQQPLWQIEKNLLGASHAEMGAALLAIWGLPTEIVESVAFHHEPSRSERPGFTPVAAVHVANALVHEGGADSQGLPPAELDLDFLKARGWEARVDLWRRAVT
ncbi:MAG: HDOD domain-containing protein [Verrucomicrobiae bacterium]|nr:HDOD domain-containing protein [Verrucomicrobiae bacterium]